MHPAEVGGEVRHYSDPPRGGRFFNLLLSDTYTHAGAQMSPVLKLTIGLSSRLEFAPHQFCFPSCVFICSESWLRTPTYRFPCAPSAGKP